jgi:hypothetical protein
LFCAQNKNGIVLFCAQNKNGIVLFCTQNNGRMQYFPAATFHLNGEFSGGAMDTPRTEKPKEQCPLYFSL